MNLRWVGVKNKHLHVFVVESIHVHFRQFVGVLLTPFYFKEEGFHRVAFAVLEEHKSEIILAKLYSLYIGKYWKKFV